MDTTQAPATTDAPQQEPSFDSAFAEFAGGKDQTEADTPQTSRAPEQVQPSPGEGAQAKTEDGAGKAAAAPSTTQAPVTASATTIDWSKAPPEYKAAFDALEQKTRSEAGREAARQRTITDLQRQLADAKAPKQQTKAPAVTVGADGKPSFMQGDRWKEFSEAYPDIAGPIAEAFGAVVADTLNVREELKPVLTDRQKDAHLAQQELLAKQHPDWETAIYGNPAFAAWFADQPQYIREAVIRNKDMIVDAEEAGHLITLFKGATQQAAPASATVTNLSDKRKQQLESGKTAPDKGAGAASGASEGFYDAFAFFSAKQEQKQKSARR